MNFLAFLWAFFDKKRRPCNAAKPSVFLGFSRFSLRGVDVRFCPREDVGDCLVTYTLFPLHRCRGFGGDVIDHAVDVADFVGDAV